MPIDYFTWQQQDMHFFSSSHATFKIDHVLGHKTHLNKYKRIEIIKCLLTDHDGIQPEINNEKISGKTPRCTRLKKKILLNNTWVKEEI